MAKISLRTISKVATVGVLVAAVAKEMNKPEDEREWNGKVGPVPYDFRMPTISKAKALMWAPDADHYIAPRLFGVGWTLNYGKLYTLAQAKFDEIKAKHCASAEDDAAAEAAWAGAAAE